MQTPRGQAPRGYAALDWSSLSFRAVNRTPATRRKREATVKERNRANAAKLDASTAAWRASLRDEYAKLNARMRPVKSSVPRKRTAREVMVAREQARADAIVARAMPALAYKPGFAG